MADRWWAPTRATVDPDAVVLALLQPDGESAGDLGATLLAVHRAGAASCETVSKGAVPSEVGLVRAMSSARERVAGLAVDAAAHSMEATYAGLFVRDLFDDAEASALALFRTVVNKGVSPPMAAARAAAVYGVPTRGLAKYIALASDPKASPVALTDEADRALLGFVSKMVSLETGEVSKAAPALAYSYDEDEHPRTADGRWSNAPSKPRAIPGAVVQPNILAQLREWKGLGGQSAPNNVAGEREPVPDPELQEVPPPNARQQRLRRTGRTSQARKQRQLAVKAKKVAQQKKAAEIAASQTSQQGFVTEPVTRTPTTRVAMTRVSPARARANRAASVKQYQKKNPDPPPADPEDPDNAMRRSRSGYGVYDEMDDPRVFYTSAADGKYVHDRMPGKSDKRVFRMHELARTAMDADYDESEDPAGNAAGTRNHMAMAEHMRLYGEVELSEEDQPVVQKYDNTMSYATGMDEDELVEQLMDKMAEGPDGNIDMYEAAQIEEAVDYFDKSTPLLVHVVQNSELMDKPEDPRPKPTIYEFYIQHGVKARVTSEGGEDWHHDERNNVEATYEYDPDQAYMIMPMTARYYDQTRHVFVNSYEIKAITDEEAEQIQMGTGLGRGNFDEFTVKKAGLALATVDRTHFEQEHPRDDEGQFSNKPRRLSGIAAATAGGGKSKTPRQLRLDRQRRNQNVRSVQSHLMLAAQKQRAARAAEQTMYRFDTELGTEREPVQRTALQRAPIARTRTARIASARTAIAQLVKPPEPPPGFAGSSHSPRVRNLLDDYSDYLVMTQKQFNAIVDRSVANQFAGSRPERLKEGYLFPEARNKLLSMDKLSADDALFKMKRLIQQQAEANGLDTLWTGKLRGGSNEDADNLKLAHRMNELFVQHPDLAYLKLVMLDESAGTGDYNNDEDMYMLKGNATKPIDPIIIVQMQRGEPLNVDLPLHLDWQNKYKLHQIAAEREQADLDDIPRSGWSAADSASNIKHYRAEYKQYKLGNPVYSSD